MLAMLIIGAENQVVLAKRMAVERMSHMLPVAVVVVVGTSAVWQEVRLVILVVSVG